MSHPLLGGRLGPAVGGRSTQAVVVIVAIVGIASVAAALRWQFHEGSPVAAQPAPAASVGVPAKAEVRATVDEQVLHLAHAERQLVSAAEQLVRADRQLVALVPDLARSYLQTERWRLENARTALDAARKALEESRDHIKLASQTGKE